MRSTHENFVKSSGLRWVCVMLLVEIPWASRVWALPFLSALAPSERYAAKRGKPHTRAAQGISTNSIAHTHLRPLLLTKVSWVERTGSR